MRGGELANQLGRLAEEARACRARLVELTREAVELREVIQQAAAEAPSQDAAPRKLTSVQ